MIPHISDELSTLASTCRARGRDPVQGWSVDVWQLTPEVVEALKSVYFRLLVPRTVEEVLARLAADGIDVSEMFVQDTEADPENLARVTRADMLEFAAAASMLAIEGIPIETLVMPNVPKRSRRQSNPGIDIMAVRLNPTG